MNDSEYFKTKQEEDIMLWSIYTILYLNDTACFSVQQLSKNVANKDKESRKIYGALLKRNSAYLNKVSVIVDRTMDYYCEFCSSMDSLCDEAYENFKKSLNDIYRESNLEDYEYLAKVEIMRTMVDLACFTNKEIIEKAKKISTHAKSLEFYNLDDMSRIANNFARWAYRKAPKDVVVNLGKNSVILEKFHIFSELLINPKSFEQCYNKTLDYALKQNKETE